MRNEAAVCGFTRLEAAAKPLALNLPMQLPPQNADHEVTAFVSGSGIEGFNADLASGRLARQAVNGRYKQADDARRAEEGTAEAAAAEMLFLRSEAAKPADSILGGGICWM